ncbi:MAG: NADH:flavin oxidoreductase [Planctomycetes bacterium]|nr:NADH:flavin oxidoreductase [Planctomycetota bacterium]
MFEHLLSPTRIGSLELRNRIAMAPMGVEIVEADGVIREPTLRYYEERARGGAGLLITENTSACYPRGANSAHEIGVSDDSFLPGLTALCEVVHKHGAKIAIQLAHHGKIARLDTHQGRELLMPSVPRGGAGIGAPLDLTAEEMGLMAKAFGGAKPKVHEATVQDLEQLVADFADAALRAQRAGFDAVEIHAAHGYLVNQFLSPRMNLRKDAYGGSPENRMRFLMEILEAVRGMVGPDYPLGIRVNGDEGDRREILPPAHVFGVDGNGRRRSLRAASADAVFRSRSFTTSMSLLLVPLRAAHATTR